jgi:lipopolysaccharide export system protein LptA
MTGAVLLAVALAATPAPRMAQAATPAPKMAQAATPAPRMAQATRRAPIRVDADEVQYAFQKHEVIFSGRRPVVLTRDDATLTCRKIVALTDEAGQIVTATCTGDVRLTRGTRLVTCDQATFHEAEERVICDGNPVLKDGGSEAKGARLVYDLRADEVKLEGAQITLPGVEIEERRKSAEEKRKAGNGGGAAQGPAEAPAADAAKAPREARP